MTGAGHSDSRILRKQTTPALPSLAARPASGTPRFPVHVTPEGPRPSQHVSKEGPAGL